MRPPFTRRRLVGFCVALPWLLVADSLPPAPAANFSKLPPQWPPRQARIRTNEFGVAVSNQPRPFLPLTNAPNYRPTIQAGPPPGARPVVNNPGALSWDAVFKEYQARAGETEAKFSFALTNVSRTNVLIESVHTSCGCTAAKLPQQPWLLAPGEHGEIGVTVDLQGKFGTITKTATITSSVGPIPLTVRINIPAAEAAGRPMGDRTRNLQIAAADRQAVFRGDCATCHVTPTIGKTGRALFDSACAICHEGVNRASMVPDLQALNKPTDHAYWLQWIAAGREGSLMPAFAAKNHGILSDAQIGSLTDYIEGEFQLKVRLPGGGSVAPPAAALLPAPAFKK